LDIDDFDLHFTKLMFKKEIIINSETKEQLPHKIGELVHLEILRVRCPRLREMPSSFGLLTALKTLDLRNNAGLKELPVALGTLASIKRIDVSECPSLHTPPKHVVERGTDAMLQFLRDLAKGEAPSHLIKVVLLGDQRAGKSSLADSLVLGRPVMRADSDRTVGIDVRRWRLGGQTPLVANIYDAAGQRVYRATHGFFMSAGALFLHVVRCDMPEEKAVAALLEWVEAVQQEAAGAVMGLVWTHFDWFADGTCSGGICQPCFLRLTGSTDGETPTWIATRYFQQLLGELSPLKYVDVVNCGYLGQRQEMHRDVDSQQRVETEDVQGKVALFEYTYNFQSFDMKRMIRVQSRGAVGVVVIMNDYYYTREPVVIFSDIEDELRAEACIPIIFIRKSEASALTRLGVKLTAFPGSLLPSCHAVCVYVPS